MSHIVPGPHNAAAVVVRAAEAEVIGYPPQTIRLLVDSSSTDGKLSTQRVTLRNGADGALPHHHTHSAELFFVIQGSVQLLVGDQVVLADTGDLAVVPEGMLHAFAAAKGADADLLIVITPGVERFEYFRLLARIARGEQPRDSLLAVQQLYDTIFDTSAAWQQARA
jgi:mannose-6-phosphate isomerase-like protein (cupin superfamily)